MRKCTNPSLGNSPSELTIGMILSKATRNKLTSLCLRAILTENKPKPLGKIAVKGRPRSPEAVLAEMVNVKQKTVYRWTNPHGVQATDSNAEKLAEIALKHLPDETSQLLRSEVEAYQGVVESWLSSMMRREG